MLLPNEFGFQSPFSAICKRGRSNEPYLKEFRNLLKKNTVASRSGIIEGGGSLAPLGSSTANVEYCCFSGPVAEY